MKEFEFEFAPGDYYGDPNDIRAYGIESRRGPVAMWTFRDLERALLAHARQYGNANTKKVFCNVTGLRTNQPVLGLKPHHIGPIIAALCRSMTRRPYDPRRKAH